MEIDDLIPDDAWSSRKPKPARREVYFVQAVTIGLVKIGVANNAETRIRALMMSSPDKLKVIGLTQCWRHGRTEEEILKRFAHLRTHGEWHRPAADLLEFIEDNSTGAASRIARLQLACDEPNKTRGRKLGGRNRKHAPVKI